MVHGRWVVCTLSFGVPGISTEKRPASEVNFAQPLGGSSVRGDSWAEWFGGSFWVDG